MTLTPSHKILLVLLGMVFSPVLPLDKPSADSSRYPQFAQQRLPEHVVPSFIHVDQLVGEIASGKRPLIIDVRTREEYLKVHIKGAISIPLDQFPKRLEEIPRDRPVVLY